MGGTQQSSSRTGVFDPQALSGIIQNIQGLSGGFGQQGLTPGEQQSAQQQLQAIELGGQQAGQQIQQTVREQATQRGLLSSRGAIAQEAAQLANIPLAQAQQRAQVFGQKGALQRQALELQLRGLMGAGQLAGIRESQSGSSGLTLGF